MNRTFGLLHSVDQFYLRSTTIASSDTIPLDDRNSRWYTIAISLYKLPEEIHSQRKYRRIMFDIKPLSFTRFILISSCLFSSRVPWNCFYTSGNSSKMDISSNSTIFIYLFIYFFTALITGDDEFTKFENIRAANCFR